MDKEVRLTPQEAEWLVDHLLEILEAIYEGKPLRSSWATETWLMVAVLLHRRYPDGPPKGGWADPRLN